MLSLCLNQTLAGNKNSLVIVFLGFLKTTSFYTKNIVLTKLKANLTPPLAFPRAV